MPETFAKNHDETMLNFRKTGKSSIIDQYRHVFAAHNGDLEKIEIFVKVCSFTDGLMFAGNIQPIDRNNKYAIYDCTGQIVECSATILKMFKWKKPYPNVYEQFTEKIEARAIVDTLRHKCDRRKSQVAIFRPQDIRSLPVELYELPLTEFVGVCNFLEINKQTLDKSYKITESLSFQRMRPGKGNAMNYDRRLFDLEANVAMKNTDFKRVKWLQFSFIFVWAVTIFGLCTC